MTALFLRLITIALVFDSLALAKEFVHPGIAHTKESIEFVKTKIAAGEQPWANQWEKMNASSYAKLSWHPKAYSTVERGPYNDPDIGSTEFREDSVAAYTHALHWAISGKEEHAQKAAEIIDAWSSKLKHIKNHDTKLIIGMVGHKFCNAAELLKHTWNGWPEAQQKQFATLLRELWYPHIKDFYPTANGNWDASMLQTMIAIGVFLDDRAMFDRATNYYLQGKGNGAITNYFMESGQCQESGRDQAHTQMGLDFLATCAETAWNQGVDLYSAADNRLLKGFEYTAKYNLGHDVPYKPYKSVEGRYHYKSISKKARGRLRPMYEKVYNHYHNRKGLEANYSNQALQKIRKYTPRPHSRRQPLGTLPWGALMFANQPTTLTLAEKTDIKP